MRDSWTNRRHWLADAQRRIRQPRKLRTGGSQNPILCKDMIDVSPRPLLGCYYWVVQRAVDIRSGIPTKGRTLHITQDQRVFDNFVVDTKSRIGHSEFIFTSLFVPIA